MTGSWRNLSVSVKIQKDLVGLIIGKGGWRIKEIKGTTDNTTNISFGKDGDANGCVECLISGTCITNLELCKSRILTIIQDYKKGFVTRFPPTVNSTIIESNKCEVSGDRRIRTDNTDEKSVSNTKNSANQVESIVMNGRKSIVTDNLDLKLKIKQTMICHIIGKEGVQINQIRDATCTQISFGKEVDENGTVECWIRGEEQGKQKAERLIKEFLKEFNKSKIRMQHMAELKRLQYTLNSKYVKKLKLPLSRRTKVTAKLLDHEEICSRCFEKHEWKGNRSCWRCDRKFGHCVGLRQSLVISRHSEMCRKRGRIVRPEPKEKNDKMAKRRDIQLNVTQCSDFVERVLNCRDNTNGNKIDNKCTALRRTKTRPVLPKENSALVHMRQTNDVVGQSR